MSYTYQSHTTSASVTSYSFSFAGSDPGYIAVSNIAVEVRASGDTEWSTLDESRWNLTGTNMITLTSPIAAPADGQNNLRIRRIVDKDKPYASFVRGSMLDMLNLDRSLIQLVEMVQEILDGFFPEGFYFQQNINMNGHKFYNLGNGTAAGDSVNFGQLTSVNNALGARITSVDTKHTNWNNTQDNQIASLQAGIASNGTAAYIPFRYVAVGGETVISPPYVFRTARVDRNGVIQHEVDGAYTISGNKITLASPLRAGDVVRCEIGTGWNPNSSNLAGPTEDRPVNPNVGYMYFDTTLNKTVWYTGTGTTWVDANGVVS